MNDLTRDAALIAQEINQIKAEVRDTAIRGAIEIGKRLMEAKSVVPYGSWGKWLEDNVSYSERTAQDLMRIAREYSRTETETLSQIQNKEQAVLLLALDARERATFVEEHDMQTISTRELEDELRRMREEDARKQLTIEELVGQVNTMTVQLTEMAGEPAPAADAEASRRAEELEKQLQEANRKVAEAEKRRLQDLEAEQAKTRAEQEKARKAAQEKNEADSLLQQQEKKLRRMEDELSQARDNVREVLPQSVEDELRRLRAQAVRTGAESDLRAAFDALKAAFERLMDKLNETETEDETLAAKYRAAFGKAMRMMAERVS